MSHIYALTCVNVLDRIADSRPLLRLEAQSRRESLRTNENGCPWGTDGFLLRFPVFGGIGLPGKAAFASMTPIKVFQPKCHIFFVDC